MGGMSNCPPFTNKKQVIWGVMEEENVLRHGPLRPVWPLSNDHSPVSFVEEDQAADNQWQYSWSSPHAGGQWKATIGQALLASNLTVEGGCDGDGDDGGHLWKCEAVVVSCCHVRPTLMSQNR